MKINKRMIKSAGRRQPARTPFVGVAAALALGAGALSMIPQAAHAQAATDVSYTTLYSFGATNDGANPYKGLTVGMDGNYYGVTYYGGTNNDGTVFQLTPSGTETVLYSFSGTDGENPRSALVMDSSGNLYGTCDHGGANNNGTVFKIVPPSGSAATMFTSLHDFTGTDGTDPTTQLVIGSDSNFYGTAELGGANNMGVVYEMTPSGTVTDIYSFMGTTDGNNPIGGLMLNSADGNIYGTSLGGASNDGVIFEFTPNGATAVTPTTLYSFSGNDGKYPEAPLVAGNDGQLYGTTVRGGANTQGTVFKITTTGTLTTLYTFSADNGTGNTDGARPYGTLLLAGNGTFYGTTRYGGASDGGTVFQMSAAGKLATLYQFTADNSGNTDGANPFCELIKDSSGALYGTTNDGGVNSAGTVFKLVNTQGSGQRFDFNNDGHADLFFYNNSTGGVAVWDMNDTTVLSYGGPFATVDPSSGWIPVTTPTANGDGFPDLMWWNRNTGEMSLWTLADTSVIQYGADFATIADTDWQPVAVGDDTGTTYNLVFQNSSTGDISSWKMSGSTVLQYGGTIASLGAGSPWTVVGAPDLDQDGKSDLLFYNTQTGEVSYWSCNLSGSQVLAYHSDIAQVTDLNQHLIGAEDLNGDGSADLIWRDQSTGAISRWLMNGPVVAQYGATFAQINDLNWRPDAIR